METYKPVVYVGYLIKMVELQEALRRTKTRKSTGQDGFNAQLFKYGVISVSYTHLDVYKRQPLLFTLLPPPSWRGIVLCWNLGG